MFRGYWLSSDGAIAGREDIDTPNLDTAVETIRDTGRRRNYSETKFEIWMGSVQVYSDRLSKQ